MSYTGYSLHLSRIHHLSEQTHILFSLSKKKGLLLYVYYNIYALTKAENNKLTTSTGRILSIPIHKSCRRLITPFVYSYRI